MVTSEQALSATSRLHDALVRRRKSIATQYDYLNGKQPLKFATSEWKSFHQERFKGFSDNWCEVVAQTPVDRLQIIGLRISGSADTITGDERQLWEDWQRNELTSQSNQGFLASSVAKRSFTLVWGDEDDNPQVTWERPDQAIIEYDDAGRKRLRALKSWASDDIEYATLYLPDAVWKWQRPKSVVERASGAGLVLPSGLSAGIGGWVPREVDDEEWPLPNPLGVVPMVEWPNRPRLGGDPISDIDGVMAMQDTMNAMWGFLFPAADHASMPARVIMGGDMPKVPVLDADGQMIGTRPAKMEELNDKRFLYLTGAAKIGQYEAASADFFLKVIVQALGHVAAQTRTPGHYLLTNEKFANLNGDALTAAEVPLSDKVGNQQTHYNPAAKETAALMALVRGKKDLADAIRGSDGARFVHWKDRAMHSLQQLADAATKDRAVGMSLRTVLERRYGFTEPEIERELNRIRDEQRIDPEALLDPVTLAAIKGAAGGDTNPPAGA
ncbi:phage portal protein [Aeromicrobium sp.]|uniref:phage portal protein n=1 Tax=Aeromicrobium sp. TaxID=1871063 RepID=UPI002FC5CB02